MIIINASNVHQGGGKILLEALMKSIDVPCILFSDNRLNLNEQSNVQRVIVKPTVAQRVIAEIKLFRLAKVGDQILCFGNLPLLLPSRASSYLFFQNMILLEKNSCFKFTWKENLKHRIERRWLRWGLSRVDKVFVQSETVRDEFLKEFPKSNVIVAPFAENLPNVVNRAEKEFDFVYISSGDAHKNHRHLFEAWLILAKENIFPSLVLTVTSNYKEICALVNDMETAKLKIYNKPNLSHSQVLDLYSQAKALIYPSLTESFGLPLIEAQSLGLPILASELDYVRELVSPVESFDPQSPKSIARAVKRFLKLPPNLQKTSTAKEFFEVVFKV